MSEEPSPPGRFEDSLWDLSPDEIRAHARRVREMLCSRSLQARQDAAEAYARAGLPTEDLRLALESERDDHVAAGMCDALAQLGDLASVQLLREVALGHRGPWARRSAMLALRKLQGKETVPFLQQLAARGRMRSNRALLDVLLLDLGDREARARVLDAISSPNVRVREHVAAALRELRPRRDRAALRAALKRQRTKDPKGDVYLALTYALMELEPKSRWIRRSDPFDLDCPPRRRRRSSEFCRTVREMDPQQIRSRLAWVRDHLGSRDRFERSSAATAYIQAGLPLDDVFDALGRETSHATFTATCYALTWDTALVSLPALARIAAEHRSSAARGTAAGFLWCLAETDEALSYFRTLLATERSRRRRAHLAAVLVAHDDAEALPELLKAIRSRDEQVRDQAATDLRWHPPKAHRAAALRALRAQLPKEDDPDMVRVFEDAIEALATKPPFDVN